MNSHHNDHINMKSQKENNGKWITILIVAKLLCCGLPILLLSGVALTSFSANWLLISAGVIISALISFLWFRRRKNRRLICTDGNAICVSEKAASAKKEIV